MKNPAPSAQRTAQHLFEHITQFTRTTWRDAVEKSLQMKIPDFLITAVVFEAMYFGEYYMRTRQVSGGASANGQFAKLLHNNIVMLFAETYFDSESKLHGIDRHYDEVEEMYDDFRAERLDVYDSSGDEEAPVLLRDRIVENFLSQDIPIHPQIVDGYVQAIIKDIDALEI